MESLALVVTLMVMSCVFSGPIALLLTSKTAQRLTHNRFLKIFRRVLLGIVSAIGIFLSIIFIIESIPPTLKVIAIATVILNVWAFKREYRRSPHGPASQS